MNKGLRGFFVAGGTVFVWIIRNLCFRPIKFVANRINDYIDLLCVESGVIFQKVTDLVDSKMDTGKLNSLRLNFIELVMGVFSGLFTRYIEFTGVIGFVVALLGVAFAIHPVTAHYTFNCDIRGVY